MRIVIPGGSGQVGRILKRYFEAQGSEIVVPPRGFDAAVLEGCDVCINLAGRSS